MGVRASLVLIMLAAFSLPSLADAGSVHTSLSEFDACEPLRDGRVAAGSGGGLVFVDGKGEEHSRLTALDGLPGTRVHALEVVGDAIWVGTDSGIAKVSMESGRVDAASVVATGPVRDLLVDGDSVLAATWGQGLVRIREGVVHSVYRGETSRSRRITAIERHKGRIWWTTAGAGLWSMRPGKPAVKSTDVAGNAVLWALHSHASDLWVGGELGATHRGARQAWSRSIRDFSVINGGVHAASFGEGFLPMSKAARIAAPGDRFARSLGARGSVVCIGTQEALWIRKGRSPWRKASLRESLPANDIAAFVSDGKRRFVGTFDHGVAELAEDGSVRSMHLGRDPHVNALAIDAKSGALWVGTSKGLTYYRGGNVTRFKKASGLPSGHVMSLHALRGGGVLVGTAAGAARVEDGEVRPVGGKGRLLTGNVWAVAEGNDGGDWLGTTRGVFHVQGTTVRRYRVASGELPDDWVMALAVADDGVFVGTYKAGVIRLVTTGENVVAKRLGPGWINPSGLHWDGTTLRAATMHGAFRGDGEQPSWHSKTKGLGRDTTSFQAASGGREWIVTRRGLELRDYTSKSK